MAENRVNLRSVLLAGMVAIGIAAWCVRWDVLQREVYGDELLAPTPPMGWNSWDAYGTTIN